MGWWGDLINQLDSWSPTKDLQHDLTSEAGRLGYKVGDKWNWDWLKDESRWVRENPAAARAKGAQIAALWYLGSQFGGGGGGGGGGSGAGAGSGGGAVWNSALADSAVGSSGYGASGASMGYGAYGTGAGAVDSYLNTGGSDGWSSSGDGGYAGMLGDGGGVETLGGWDTATSGPGGYAANPVPGEGGGMLDSMQEYLRRMSKTPQGRMALARLAGGAYGANENRKLRKELNNVDITAQPGYRAGEQAVRRRMASQGYGNSGNMLTELQDYGGRFYNDYAENRRKEVGAKTGNLGNMMSLLSLMSTGG